MKNEKAGGQANDKKKLPYTSPKITMQEMQRQQSPILPTSSSPATNKSTLSSLIKLYLKEFTCKRNKK
ncbi:hypothetical protein [Sphingobacterium sp.]|uniref:hypothetical protein n=1 Tax=Sphingobacterium sp. TaxID=341027 RepID=UPI002898CB7B|nr:hypothetical protein [Sphingobacterium sp.]